MHMPQYKLCVSCLNIVCNIQCDEMCDFRHRYAIIFRDQDTHRGTSDSKRMLDLCQPSYVVCLDAAELMCLCVLAASSPRSSPCTWPSHACTCDMLWSCYLISSLTWMRRIKKRMATRRDEHVQPDGKRHSCKQQAKRKRQECDATDARAPYPCAAYSLVCLRIGSGLVDTWEEEAYVRDAAGNVLYVEQQDTPHTIMTST